MSSYTPVCLVFAAIAIIASATNYSDCSSKLRTLEHALYDTEDNLFELNRVFFPPSTRTSRFIRVTYKFLDELNHCNVTYIWAIGSFLFFQPPRIFMFNSLFFNYPNNDLTDLYLTLPGECRPLIGEELNGKCSCTDDSKLLDILTQQVLILQNRFYGPRPIALYCEQSSTMHKIVMHASTLFKGSQSRK